MRTKVFCRVGCLLLILFHTSSPRDALAQQMLAAHNFYRARVGTPPLAWSDELATRAQQWATTLIERGTYAPRREGPYGENLFEISGARANAFDVVRAWASEQADYDHTTNSCRRRCGHYTQVVWRSTRRVGCGIARSAQREVWVCDYDPHGNTVGERLY
jgi:pathogenesis-related protein 1